MPLPDKTAQEETDDQTRLAEARASAASAGLDPVTLLKRVPPRAAVRAAFFLFFLFACWRLLQFYQWALGNGAWVPRPEATAGFVPLGAFMSLFAWMKSGVFDPVMPASVVILLGALLLSILFKRGFCGWICPVGSGASFFGWLGRKVFGRTFAVNRKVDIALRVPKYLIAAMILFQMASLPAEVGLQFQTLPYYATSDLKILWGLMHPEAWYLGLFVFVGLTSMLWGNTWCRYLCPLGALYGATGAASLGTVGRDKVKCIDCNKCTKVCPAKIDVAKANVVRDPECDGCQECVRVCPKPGAMTARFGGMQVPWQFWPVLLVLVWMFVFAFATSSGHWRHGLPDETVAQYMQTMKLSADWGEEQ